MSIVLQGATSGSVTLQEPAVAGTTVLDLPATSGTILTTASSGQSIPKAALPTGSVLQVVTASTTTSTSTTSITYVPTSVAVSITPTSSSSKILILHSGMGNIQTASVWCWVTLYRGATNLYAGGASDAFGGVLVAGSSDAQIPVSIIYLDSPATTSSTTYTVYIRNSNGSSTARYNADGWRTTITALEIAA
jgi:hypothetical protein